MTLCPLHCTRVQVTGHYQRIEPTPFLSSQNSRLTKAEHLITGIYGSLL